MLQPPIHSLGVGFSVFRVVGSLGVVGGGCLGPQAAAAGSWTFKTPAARGLLRLSRRRLRCLPGPSTSTPLLTLLFPHTHSLPQLIALCDLQAQALLMLLLFTAATAMAKAHAAHATAMFATACAAAAASVAANDEDLRRRLSVRGAHCCMLLLLLFSYATCLTRPSACLLICCPQHVLVCVGDAPPPAVFSAPSLSSGWTQSHRP